MNHRLKYLLILFLAVPAWAMAHGLVTTQSQTVGDFLVEFEYNTIGNIIAGDYMLFDVYLLDPATREGIDFDSAFIRIEKQDGPGILAGNMVQAPGIQGYSSISGVINDSGTYTAEVSFYRSDKTLAESKFNFIVDENQFDPSANSANSKKPFYFLVYLFLAGLVLGVAGTWLLGVYKPPKT